MDYFGSMSIYVRRADMNMIRKKPVSTVGGMDDEELEGFLGTSLKPPRKTSPVEEESREHNLAHIREHEGDGALE
jgi:hypothetical protein